MQQQTNEKLYSFAQAAYKTKRAFQLIVPLFKTLLSISQNHFPGPHYIKKTFVTKLKRRCRNSAFVSLVKSILFCLYQPECLYFLPLCYLQQVHSGVIQPSNSYGLAVLQ